MSTASCVTCGNAVCPTCGASLLALPYRQLPSSCSWMPPSPPAPVLYPHGQLLPQFASNSSPAAASLAPVARSTAATTSSAAPVASSYVSAPVASSAPAAAQAPVTRTEQPVQLQRLRSPPPLVRCVNVAPLQRDSEESDSDPDWMSLFSRNRRGRFDFEDANSDDDTIDLTK